jgi:hypothetical protein
MYRNELWEIICENKLPQWLLLLFIINLTNQRQWKTICIAILGPGVCQ